MSECVSNPGYGFWKTSEKEKEARWGKGGGVPRTKAMAFGTGCVGGIYTFMDCKALRYKLFYVLIEIIMDFDDYNEMINRNYNRY
jgi:hypothetical protein